VYIHTYIHTYIYIHTHTNIYIHTYTHTYIHTYIHEYIYIYIYIYIMTYVHVYLVLLHVSKCARQRKSSACTADCSHKVSPSDSHLLLNESVSWLVCLSLHLTVCLSISNSIFRVYMHEGDVCMQTRVHHIAHKDRVLFLSISDTRNVIRHASLHVHITYESDLYRSTPCHHSNVFRCEFALSKAWPSAFASWSIFLAPAYRSQKENARLRIMRP
jgi:hypothetical protein